LKGTSHLPPGVSKTKDPPVKGSNKMEDVTGITTKLVQAPPVDPTSRENRSPHTPLHNKTSAENLVSFTIQEVMLLPVEKLCSDSGKVLECFATAEAARRSVTASEFQKPFHDVLLGRYDGNSRVYKGFFWRLKCSSHLPPGISRTTNQPAKHINLNGGARHRPTPTNPSSLSEQTNTVQLAPLNQFLRDKQNSLMGKKNYKEQEETQVHSAASKEKHYLHPTSSGSIPNASTRKDGVQSMRQATKKNILSAALDGSGQLLLKEPPVPPEKRKLDSPSEAEGPSKRMKEGGSVDSYVWV
jgi:hypothetical protein